MYADTEHQSRRRVNRIVKWWTDFVIIYHEQERLDGKGVRQISPKVSPLEEARLIRSLNARMRLDSKGRYAQVIWSRTGRTGRVYDEEGMWKGVPEKLDALIWDDLTEAEEALANGAAPAVFADPQTARAWGLREHRRGQKGLREAQSGAQAPRCPPDARPVSG